MSRFGSRRKVCTFSGLWVKDIFHLFAYSCLRFESWFISSAVTLESLSIVNRDVLLANNFTVHLRSSVKSLM